VRRSGRTRLSGNMAWILVLFVCIAGECQFVTSEDTFWSENKCLAHLTVVINDLQQIGTAVGVCINVNII
jgi:hypothetical protein